MAMNPFTEPRGGSMYRDLGYDGGGGYEGGGGGGGVNFEQIGKPPGGFGGYQPIGKVPGGFGQPGNGGINPGGMFNDRIFPGGGNPGGMGGTAPMGEDAPGGGFNPMPTLWGNPLGQPGNGGIVPPGRGGIWDQLKSKLGGPQQATWDQGSWNAPQGQAAPHGPGGGFRPGMGQPMGRAMNHGPTGPRGPQAPPQAPPQGGRYNGPPHPGGPFPQGPQAPGGVGSVGQGQPNPELWNQMLQAQVNMQQPQQGGGNNEWGLGNSSLNKLY